ncbi:hypothetical protein ABWL39_14040 [Chitinivorax sp. PXF-14]|uniref:hypothetical protein n=1 Tax=Chitinivorax sp. PXF-14 TaxID=3230488 RepID=UPI003466127A
MASTQSRADTAPAATLFPANYSRKVAKRNISPDVARIAGLYPHLQFCDYGDGVCFVTGDEASLRALNLIPTGARIPQKPRTWVEFCSWIVGNCPLYGYKLSMTVKHELCVWFVRAAFIDPTYLAFRRLHLAPSADLLTGEAADIY